MGTFADVALTLEPGDRGTFRFAFPTRYAVGDLIVAEDQVGEFEYTLRVVRSTAVPFGDVTIVYVLESIRRLASTEGGSNGKGEGEDGGT